MRAIPHGTAQWSWVKKYCAEVLCASCLVQLSFWKGILPNLLLNDSPLCLLSEGLLRCLIKLARCWPKLAQVCDPTVQPNDLRCLSCFFEAAIVDTEKLQVIGGTVRLDVLRVCFQDKASRSAPCCFWNNTVCSFLLLTPVPLAGCYSPVTVLCMQQ